jgi:Glycosyl hydrolase family 26
MRPCDTIADVKSTAGVDARREQGKSQSTARTRNYGARRLFLLALCASFLLGCSAASTGSGETAAASTPADTLGIYPGPADTRGVTYFEKRLGRKVGVAHQYLDGSTWSSIQNVDWLVRAWAPGYSKRFALTVPILPKKGATLAKGAAGKYNQHFRELARRLVRGGLGSTILRLGPEFNGKWFPWRINRPGGATNFIGFWRQIVATMRAVPGAHFKFDWCANAGSAYIKPGKQLNAASAWPGDKYVDYVGLDVFDQSWGAWRKDPVKRWNEYVTQHDGMAWQASFATAHNKQISFPEWGLVDRMDGHGGGDNPYFIKQMYTWIQTHNVAYHIYFEDYDPNADYGVFSGWFPNAANTFIDLFGSRATVGQGLGLNDSAQLRVTRARLKGSKRFGAITQFSKRASGEARVQIAAGGRKMRFTAMFRNGKGRLTINKAISKKMGRKRTGVLTIAYGGDEDTNPQLVRLRAGPRTPRLKVQAPTIADGRLAVRGQVAPRARGTVLVQLRYVVDATIVTRSFSARISGGHWNLSSPLGDIIRAEIDRRQGPVTAAVLYPGYAPRRIRGELRSYRLLGPR